MSDETELMPCPFCGGTTAEVCGVDAGGPHAESCWWVTHMCRDVDGVIHCATIGNFQTKAEAITAWNRRASRQPVPAALERLLHATPGSYIMFTRCDDGSVSLDVTVDDGHGHESASFSEGPTLAAAVAAARSHRDAHDSVPAVRECVTCVGIEALAKRIGRIDVYGHDSGFTIETASDVVPWETKRIASGPTLAAAVQAARSAEARQ